MHMVKIGWVGLKTGVLSRIKILNFTLPSKKLHIIEDQRFMVMGASLLGQ